MKRTNTSFTNIFTSLSCQSEFKLANNSLYFKYFKNSKISKWKKTIGLLWVKLSGLKSEPKMELIFLDLNTSICYSLWDMITSMVRPVFLWGDTGNREWQILPLTHSVSEWRFDDIRLSGISRAQISIVEFLESKWLLSQNSFLHILFF